jgi:molybdopterin molybdotransferase
VHFSHGEKIFYDRSMSVEQTHSSVLSFEEARRVVEEHAANVQPRGKEPADLLRAAGRVLAESIVADRDMPPFPRSTRDGYAVRAADLAQLPAKLEVIGEIKAGAAASDVPARVDRGQAVSIMTGAPVPTGADAVVMVEYTAQKGRSIEITRGVAAGENIVAQGAEAAHGSLLLVHGTRLNAAAIALAASVGKEKLDVFMRPRVAVLATGDEIVDVAVTPGPTQIRNSNTYSLAVQIQQAGGEPVRLPIAPDAPRELRKLIEQGLQSDLLLLTGGVSMGRYDLVEQVLAELQAEFFFTGAKIQPGRPVVFGRVPCGAGAFAGGSARATCAVESELKREFRYFFGLPGNPVSTMVTFDLFVRPLLEALTGASRRKLVFLHARAKSDIRVKTGLRRFLPAMLSGEFENTEVELVSWQGSGDIGAVARANCYVVIPADCGKIAAGEWTAVIT